MLVGGASLDPESFIQNRSRRLIFLLSPRRGILHSLANACFQGFRERDCGIAVLVANVVHGSERFANARRVCFFQTGSFALSTDCKPPACTPS